MVLKISRSKHSSPVPESPNWQRNYSCGALNEFIPTFLLEKIVAVSYGHFALLLEDQTAAL